ncbi:tyrosine-type recombinase/integrase [Mobiluncus mulieris]|uniref:tyrosine-type recombinase/integrase n=1 Tax=Mobiluncus mulieris TaxID=2052 RepID=UPI00242CFD10|nr:tyrosine-type recombinase/integrase [Mobiluncus mulieris]
MSTLPQGSLWRPLFDDFTACLLARGIRPRTIETRLNYLQRLANTGVAPDKVTEQFLLDFSACHEWMPETRHSAFSSFRQFFAWAHHAGRLESDPAADLPAIKRFVPPPRPISELDFEEALDRADERTRLILLLAGKLGLRRSEICLVHARDIQQDLLGYSLVVHGKGGKTRVVPIPDSLVFPLRHAAEDGGFVFPSLTAREGHLTSGTVAKLAKRVLPTGVCLHQLRHRFATVVYIRTKDLRAVQMLLGHDKVSTTQRYVAMDDQRLRLAVNFAA